MQKPADFPTMGIVIIGIVIFLAGILLSPIIWPSFTMMMPGGAGFGSKTMPTGYSMTGGMMGHSVNIRNDADFLMEMIPHHQEAVDTAAYALTRTQDAEMKTFLQGIIDSQSAEISQMKRWHKDWFGKEYLDDRRYGLMMPDLKSLPDNQVIPAFLHGMIMHHMGAIEMARIITPITNHSEITLFAQTIIRVQSEEIGRMLEWLSARAGYSSMMMH